MTASAPICGGGCYEYRISGIASGFEYISSSLTSVPQLQRLRNMIVFFDIDDTLIDQSSSERSAASQLWEGLDLRSKFTLDEFLSEWDQAKNRSISKYLKGEITFTEQRRERIRHFYPKRKLEAGTADSYFNIYKERFEASWSLFTDVMPCLDGIKNMRLGVISNGDSDQQRKKLRSTQIFDRFETIVISGDAGVSKPQKEIFLEACNQMRTPPQKCLYIGDNIETDIKGCISAGMHGILIDREKRLSQHPFRIINSLTELNNKVVNQSFIQG